MGTTENWLLSFRNPADDGTLSDPNGDWSSDRPLSSLQTTLISDVARTKSGVTSTTFRVDLGLKKTINIVTLHQNNLSTGGKWRVRIARDSNFNTVVYDSGTVFAWPRIQWGELPYGEFPWNGRLVRSDTRIARLQPDTVRGRYLEVILEDQNNGDNFLEAGRFRVDAAVSTSVNVQFGTSYRWRDPSRKSRSVGGAPWTAQRAQFREIDLPLDFIATQEMQSTIYAAAREVGKGGEVYFELFPGRSDIGQTLRWLGTISRLPDFTIESPMGDNELRTAAELSIAETRA